MSTGYRCEWDPKVAGWSWKAATNERRAVSRCAPYNLPAEKYDAWADVIVNFDPSEMF